MSLESGTAAETRIDIGTILAALWARKLRILFVTLLLLGATFAVLQFFPKQYESSASILVEPRDNAYTRTTLDSGGSASSADPSVVSSQIELLKSRDTMLKVIAQLDLRSVPEFNGSRPGLLDPLLRLLGRGGGPSNVDEAVLGNLYDRLTVIQERDSRIISVYVKSEDPQLAARIANAIAAAHVARRAELSLSDTATSSVWLQDEITRLRTGVQAAEAAVAQFRIDNDIYVGTNNSTLLDQQMSTLANQIAAAQERSGGAATRATLIRQLIEQGQPIDGLPDVRDSLVIQQLAQSKATLQGERAQRAATLLSSHPTIRALDAQIEELTRQIALEGRRVADALDAQASIEAGTVQSLQDELTRLKTSAATAATQTVQLQSLEREAKAQRDLLESYLLRYTDAISRSDSNSAFPDVRVITEAAPAVAPASPKTGLTLLAVGLVAVTLQVGWIIFAELVSGRALAPVVARSYVRPEAEVDVEHEINLAQEPARIRDPELGVEPYLPPAHASAEAEAAGHFADTEVAAAKPSSDVMAAEAVSSTTPLRAPRSIPSDRFRTFVATRSARDDDEQGSDAMPEMPYTAPVLYSSEPAEDVSAPTADSVGETTIAAEAEVDEPVVAVAEPLAPAVAEEDEAIEAEAATVSEPDAPIADTSALDDLEADLTLGRVRVVMLAALGPNRDAEVLGNHLITTALAKGLSVCRVDAGSGRPSPEPGLTDLASDAASYGDVVHKISRDLLAEVPWGHGTTIDRTSAKPLTLVDALTDIYEVVIVLTGRVGMASALPVFAGLDCRLVLVASGQPNPGLVAAVGEDMSSLGYTQLQVVVVPEREAEVA